MCITTQEWDKFVELNAGREGCQIFNHRGEMIPNTIYLSKSLYAVIEQDEDRVSVYRRQFFGELGYTTMSLTLNELEVLFNVTVDRNKA